MQVQLNTDSNIEGREKLAAHVAKVVEHHLDRFRTQLTRVEVHLSDQNGNKGGADDKRCVMEARLDGRKPCAVSHSAANLDQAIDGAINKLKRMIETTLEKAREH